MQRWVSYMGRWSNSVVFITGASAGIGEALARRVASEGGKVALGARRIERLDTLVQELEAQGSEAIAIQCDVTDEAAMRGAIDTIIERFGTLDAVVANAGFGVAGTLMKLSNEDYRRQFETNVYGVMNTLRAAYPALKRSNGRAAIVSSVNGFISLPSNSAYAMSKFAVRALAQSLWAEWRADGISTTLICPGFVTSEIRQVNNRGVYRETAKDPVPSWLVMPAETAAAQMSRAIYRRKREVVITGHGKVIVWISRYLPGLTHFALSRSSRKRSPKD